MENKIIITSGPTIEPIDPVRFLSNRSSGNTGFYIAEEAKKRKIGHVVFITGPSRYIPDEIDVVKIESALEMKEHVLKYYNTSDIGIMAAAVSDFSRDKIYPEKIKKTKENFTLKLVKNRHDRQINFVEENIEEESEQKGKNISLELTESIGLTSP